MAEVPSAKTRLVRNGADFANIVKAFIGSNYIGMPFAFLQSGLGLGLGGLLLIATVTDHCCHLIVDCKKELIRQIMTKYSSQRVMTAADLVIQTHRQKRLERSLTYGDLGRKVFGTGGLIIVNLALLQTQFFFLVGYFVFLGNTLQTMWPTVEVNSTQWEAFDLNISVTTYNDSLHLSQRYVRDFSFKLDSSEDIPSILQGRFEEAIAHLPSIDKSYLQDVSFSKEKQTTATLRKRHAVKKVESVQALGSSISSVMSTDLLSENFAVGTESSRRISDMEVNNNNVTSTTTTASGTTAREHLSTTANESTSSPATVAPAPSNATVSPTVYVSTAPAFPLILLIPYPMFVFFSYLRSVRSLGPISVLANLSILAGFISVLVYMLIGLEVKSSHIKWYQLETFPVFFGQVTGAFEGIGTVIPIEASMEGNRHNFSKFLRTALFLVSLILGCFGVVGYLRFGDNVQQMISQNLPTGSVIAQTVNMTLCIGVAFTYPMQLVPVVEIIEGWLFAPGKCCGPTFDSNGRSGSVQSNSQSDPLLLDDDDEDEEEESGGEKLTVAMAIPDSVSAWKRNLLRTLLVTASGAMALLLKDDFAYIGAFSGAVGSTILAFILPCAIHLKLYRGSLGYMVIIKDVLIILFGLVGGTVSLYSVIRRMIHQVSKHL
ncbi:uncharacterized protein [Branchiostoma lanceolatum]|uniref:uncharacterized protein isoform X1 n=1 Tax=Branchiostoma lanceolatum TaxID=7740 RepID=UPI00345705D6